MLPRTPSGALPPRVAVRQTGIFTAVIQPPLILFVAVPGAYFLFHGGTMNGLKDLLINCGYPLIERFPLMFFTSAIVLLVGLARWYAGMSHRRVAPAEAAEPSEGRLSAVTAKIAGLLARDGEDEDIEEAPAPRRTKQHSIDRSARTGRPAAGTARARERRPTKRTQPSRSRHARPPETEIIEPVAERPRRPRPARRDDRPHSSAARTAPQAAHVVDAIVGAGTPQAAAAGRANGGPPTSGPTGTAGSTASSPSNRPRQTAPTGTGPTAAATTRSRECGTAGPTTASSIRSIGPGHAPPNTRPMPGSTTSRRT